MKSVKPGLSNFGTGLSATAFTAGIVFGGAAMVGGIQSGVQYAKNQRNLGPTQYMGNIPEIYYDATPQADRVTGDKTLGATGDLVFGLHNAR